LCGEERRARRAAAGQAPDPPLVIFSRRFDVPWEAPLFEAAEQPVLIFTAVPGAVPDVAAPVEVVLLEPYSSAAALADLRARGVRALLSEGGPTLFRGLIGDGVVDELFLTLSPELVGGDERRVIPGPPLDPVIELSLQWVLQAEGELFLRYRLG
jgi:riboflavin biosynthesis pyrimidine reductase